MKAESVTNGNSIPRTLYERTGEARCSCVLVAELCRRPIVGPHLAIEGKTDLFITVEILSNWLILPRRKSRRPEPRTK